MARLVESGADVRQIAFSIASRSLPEGFAPDTLVHESRAASDALGLAADALTVHDFEVRTFPEVRQEILELLIEVAARVRARGGADADDRRHPPGPPHDRRRGPAGVQAHDDPRLRDPLEPVQLREAGLRRARGAPPRREGARRSSATASQQHRNYANEEYIRNLARTHGIEIGRPFAECFEVVRWVV